MVTVELACPTCGVWRGEMREEQDWYPCPVCTRAAKVCHILEGFTRRAIVTEWRQIAKPLSERAKTWILGEHFLEDRSHLKDGREVRRRNGLYRGQTVATAR